MHTSKLLTLTGISLLCPITFAVTPPSTCQYKVFLDGYPVGGCVVPNTGPVGVNLAASLFLAPGDCKDSPELIRSFRNAISNDAKATTCTLTAYDKKGCTGHAFKRQPHTEAEENSCVEYTLISGNVLGAKSFRLTC